MQRIIRNAIKCNFCGQIIESKYRHEFKRCRCGRVAVDGGHDYLRRVYQKESDFTDISVVSKEQKKEQED